MRAPVARPVAPGVHRVALGRGPLASNVYLVRSDAAWVLVDAGWGGSVAAIRSAAESLFGPGARPAAVLLTHIHPDHSGAAGDLARDWDVPVYAHPDELPMAAGRYLPQYAMPLDRWVVVPLMRLLPAGRRERMVRSISDVTRALPPAGGVPALPDWTWIATPGHTPGHVAYLRPCDRVLLSGDALLTVDLNSVRGLLFGGWRQTSPPRYTTWDWRAAQRSMAALRALEPRVLAAGHGEVLSAPPGPDHRTRPSP